MERLDGLVWQRSVQCRCCMQERLSRVVLCVVGWLAVLFVRCVCVRR